MDTEILIHADKLSLIRGYRLLFKDLSFSLSAGQAIHLKGQNGSGKTSLFKLLTTSLKPNTGQLQLFGKNSDSLEPDDYDNLIYLGHQSAIKTDLSVIENLQLSAKVFDRTQPTSEVLHYALEQVGLSKFHQQLAGKLSAGQKRRIMLARLWVNPISGTGRKTIWLLDEPLTALDVGAIETLQTHIDAHLNHQGGVIFTSHQAFELSHPIQIFNLSDSL